MVPEVGHGVKALPEVVVGVLGVGKIEILYCYNGQDLSTEDTKIPKEQVLTQAAF